MNKVLILVANSVGTCLFRFWHQNRTNSECKHRLLVLWCVYYELMVISVLLFIWMHSILTFIL